MIIFATKGCKIILSISLGLDHVGGSGPSFIPVNETDQKGPNLNQERRSTSRRPIAYQTNKRSAESDINNSEMERTFELIFVSLKINFNRYVWDRKSSTPKTIETHGRLSEQRRWKDSTPLFLWPPDLNTYICIENGIHLHRKRHAFASKTEYICIEKDMHLH